VKCHRKTGRKFQSLIGIQGDIEASNGRGKPCDRTPFQSLIGIQGDIEKVRASPDIPQCIIAIVSIPDRDSR
jgi:hypothetical protein